MELENKKTVSVNKNENKGNKNVDEFQEYFLQQKQANTKVETQSDMSLVCHIINLPLIKLVRSSWLYIGLSLFMFLWTSNSTQAIKMQRRTWLISSHLDLVLGQYTFIVKRFLWGLDFLLGQGKILSQKNRKFIFPFQVPVLLFSDWVWLTLNFSVATCLLIPEFLS